MPPAPARTQLVFESHISAPASAVFGFHERPDAFRLLTPWWSGGRIERAADSLHPGQRAVLRFGFWPFTQRWEAIHVGYDPPRSFEEHQLSGPFRSWQHRHLVVADGEHACYLRDEVTFEAPGGPLLPPLATWLLRPFLAALFRYRHAVTRRETGRGQPRDDA